MSYRSGSPGSRLGDGRWRRLHSAWLLAVIFGFGLLSFVGFLYCAIRVRNRKWWTRAAVTGGLSALGWVLMSLFVESNGESPASTTSSDAPGPADDLAIGFVIALWIGSVIYGFVVNREYLRWRAESRAWYSQPSDAGSAVYATHDQHQQERTPRAGASAPLLGVDPSVYYAPPPQPAPMPFAAPPVPAAPPSYPGSVDVNSADAITIASMIGISEGTTARIVAVRDQRRGFQGMDDLVAAVGLQPHELMKLRGTVIFGPYVAPTPPGQAPPVRDQPRSPNEPRSGRILDY